MKIQILSLIKGSRILVNSDYGEFNAFWNNSEPPIKGKQYDVEFDIPYKFTYSEISISNHLHPAIYSIDEQTYIMGKIDSYEDKVLCMTIGGTIFLIETVEDHRFYKLKNNYVVIMTDQLNLYDTKLLL